MERTLLSNGIVVTVNQNQDIYDKGSVLVDGHQIAAVGSRNSLINNYEFEREIDLEGKLVLPGFVNTHSHSGLIRGLAEDLPVFEWLSEHVDPTYEAMTPELARAAYELCFAEGVKAGVTCTLDMWQYMDQAVEVAEEYGLRTVLVPYVASDQEYDYLSSIEENRKLVDRTQSNASDRIQVWFGIEHLSYASKSLVLEAFELAEEYDVGFHAHVEEAKGMANDIEKEYGKRPIELFADWGILDSRTHLAHCVWPTSKELQLLANYDVSVAHCPTANQKLGSGVAPISDMVNSGITVGLGSDGNKANNRVDIIQEMKLAALLQKVQNLDPTLLPAEKVLQMATIDGARALGLEDEIGSIEPGKRADLSIFDVKTLHMSPVRVKEPSNIIPNIVHALQAGDAESVIIDGEFVLRDKAFRPKPEDELIEAHNKATNAILQRRRNMQ